MNKLTDTAIRFYRRLFGAGTQTTAGDQGHARALTGQAAVALTELMLSDSAWFDPGVGSQIAAQTWNSAAATVPVQRMESTRAAMAGALGQALGGTRTALFVSASGLASAQDMLCQAVALRAPLVLQVSLDDSGPPGLGALALHWAAESGAFALVASNVQEAADFTLIARRVAELSLIPGLVVMDAAAIALAPQSVQLPPPRRLQPYLGRAADNIPAPTPAQRILFGEQRRRVPLWQDLDQPVMLGARLDDTAALASAAGQQPYFAAHYPELWEQALDDLTRLTGRHPTAIRCDLNPDAQLLLLAQGPLIETLCAQIERLPPSLKLKIGVIGLRSRSPLPMTALQLLVARARHVVVLEPPAPALGEAPCLRMVRAALATMIKPPALLGVTCGSTIEPEQLAGLCLDLSPSTHRSMGVIFTDSRGDHPKRQIMLDGLRRAYPQLAGRQITSQALPPLPAPAPGERHLALHLSSRAPDLILVEELADLLFRLAGGVLRCRKIDGQGTHQSRQLHLLSQGPRIPLALKQSQVQWHLLADLPPTTLTENGVHWPANAQVLWLSEPPPATSPHGVQLHCLAPQTLEADARRHYRLGAILALLQQHGLLEGKPRHLLAAHRESLPAGAESENLRQAFELGLDAWTHPTPVSVQFPATTATLTPKRTPMAVRHLGHARQEHASLPRLWDQVGVLYRDAELGTLTADPFMAAPCLPPLSASFCDLGLHNTRLPVLNAELCTTCGQCWSHCPDAAIGVTALTPREWLEAGIAQTGAGDLRPMAGKLATRITQSLRQQQAPQPLILAQLLRQAWTSLQARSELPEERRTRLDAAVQRLETHWGDLSLARGAALFDDLEQSSTEHGALLALAINPEACKSCALCVSRCPSGALRLETQTPILQEQSLRLWQQWEGTADTGAHTLERLMTRGQLDALATTQLTRHCLLALSGGDRAAPGSGERMALRQVLAVTEYLRQPVHRNLLNELESSHQAVVTAIRDQLSSALPAADLDILEQRLRDQQTRQMDLADLMSDDAEGTPVAAVDSLRLRQLVEVGQGLAKQRWQIAEGDHHLGRARYGLALAPGRVAEWAGTFPYNPFQTPVTLDRSGATGALAQGLLRAQIEQHGQATQLLRRARALLDGAHETPTSTPTATLAWELMDRDERSRAVPLWLVGNDASLAGDGLAQVISLLRSGLPVKILMLADLDLGLTQPGSQRFTPSLPDADSDLGLLAVAQRESYVAQVSPAFPQHFYQAVSEALQFPGPALLRVHGPEPLAHGFAPHDTVHQARLAVFSRAFPLWTYHPERNGVFGSRLDLTANPDPEAPWASDASGTRYHPALWWVTERRFAGLFRPLADSDANPLELNAYLALEPEARARKSPYVALTDAALAQQRLCPAPELLARMDQLAQLWRTLQELAGLKTPFTAQVEARIRAEVATKHQQALQQLQDHCDAQLTDLRLTLLNENREQVRESLLRIAGYGRNERQEPRT